MEGKRIKTKESSLKLYFENELDFLPFRLRLEIMDFFPVFVKYQFTDFQSSTKSSGKIRKICFTFDPIDYGMQFQPTFPEQMKENLHIYQKSENEEEDDEEAAYHDEIVFSSLTKRCFGYFKSDPFRKIFLIFRNFLSCGRVRYITQLYRYLPKSNLRNLLIVDPYLMEDEKLERDQILRVNSLRMEIFHYSFENRPENEPIEDQSKRLKRFNNVLDIISPNQLRQFQIFHMNLSMEKILEHLRISSFQKQVTRLTLVLGSHFSFHQALKFFPNLYYFGIGLGIDSTCNISEINKIKSGIYPSLRALKVGGKYLNDTFLVEHMNIFPNLCVLEIMKRRLILEPVSPLPLPRKISITIQGLQNFFNSNLSSKTLRRLDLTCSSVDKVDVSGNRLVDRLGVRFGTFDRFDQTTDFVLTRKHEMIEHISFNGISPLTLSQLRFFRDLLTTSEHKSGDNGLKTLDVFGIQRAQEADLIRNSFKNLRCLALRKHLIHHYTAEEGVYNSLSRMKSIEELTVEITSIYNLLIFLYWDNLRVLRVSYYTQVFQSDEELFCSPYNRVDNFEDVSREIVRVDDRKKYDLLSSIFEIFVTNLTEHRKLSKLKSFSLYVGHGQSHADSDYISRIFTKEHGKGVVDIFKNTFIDTEDNRRIRDGVVTVLQEFEFGSSGNLFDFNSSPQHISLSPIFIWKKGLGFIF